MRTLRIVLGPALFTAMLALASTTPASAAESFACPPAFPAQALTLSPTTDGWTAGTGDPALFFGADVFDGPPEQRASLQPGASSRNSSTWRFEGPSPRGIWLQCSYAGGALTLTRRLPAAPSVCVAHYPKSVEGRAVSVTFDCR
jgi:hypothetical protein